MAKERLVSFLLRAGLAVVFLYAAIASFLEPEKWVGFLPQALTSVIPGETLLIFFSIYELILGAWLLSNIRPYAAALLSSATLAAIIVQNIAQLEIIFRDVAILSGGIALVVLSRKKQ